MCAKTRNRKTHDEYVAELNEINPNLKVIGTYVNSNVKIAHSCNICGYIWDIRPSAAKDGKGCPNCNRHRKSSLKELKFYYYIKKYFSDAISGFSDDERGLSELDIYIPSIRYGFEFDGTLYHQNINRDKRKDEICDKLNIKLIRIREAGCPMYLSTCTFVYLNNNSDSHLELIITYVLEALGIEYPDVNFKRDMHTFASLCHYKDEGKKSLAYKYPEIAAEWHPTKNGNLTPNNVTYGSNKEVWWLCPKCQNEWQKAIHRRTRQGRGCPRCTYSGVATMVYCADTKEIFISMSEAGRQYKINNNDISRCCLKQRSFAGVNPISGEKLHWYYVEDKYNEGEIISKGAISLGFITRNDVNSFIERRKV